MANYEKISVYVSFLLKDKLEADARQFEVFKSTGTDINANMFLSKLILGYYDQFYIENQQNVERIAAVLRNNIRKTTISRNIEEVSLEILRELSASQESITGKKGTRLSLKPTAKTASLIQDIKNANKDEHMSNTFVRLFSSYLGKPTYIRERIIYKDIFDTLQDAIKTGSAVCFSTRQNPDQTRTVLPYLVTCGQEEIHNYLLCAEFDNDGVLKARTFRLSRIQHCRISRTRIALTEKVKGYLNSMQNYGPAYEINDNDECCVFLTEAGHRSYNMVYYQRPPYTRITPKEGGYLYFFDCSKEHVERYFRRFNSGEATVQEPNYLRDKVILSYKHSLESYEVFYEDT